MIKKSLYVKRIKITMMLVVMTLLCISCKNDNSNTTYNTKVTNNSVYGAPIVTDDDNSPSGKITTWQCVYYGSFPQIEILDDEKSISVDDYAVDDGVIRDKETYDAIIKLVDKEDGISEDQDVIYNGEKYRVESDYNYKDFSGADLSEEPNKEQYYKYRLNDVSYRIFKYAPIKWRVLDVNGNILTLLSDKILLSMKYSFEYTANWETSHIRSYLNSYNKEQEVVYQGQNYKTEKGFLDTAFTEEEKNAIIKSKIRNKNNDYYDMVSSGNDTED